MKRWVAICLISATALLTFPASAHGEHCGASQLTCRADEHGQKVEIRSAEEIRALAKAPTDRKTGLVSVDPNGPRYEYAATPSCQNARPGSLAAELSCTRSVTYCGQNGYPGGALTVIWRRTVTGRPPVVVDGEDWQPVAYTCDPSALPGSAPSLSLADIQEAFHLTPWATASVISNPPNQKTLVNLRTFFRVEFADAGFGPGEVDTLDPGAMLGNNVQIRPRIASITYTYGDGQTLTTTSLGGKYPDGDVIHTYRIRGTVNTQVSITWTADVRVNGSDWFPIGDTATVTSAPNPLTILEARAVLVR